MAEKKSKTIFTEEEYRKIKDLVGQLENSDRSKQKTIRAKIRRLGLYWSKLTTLPYTVVNLEMLLSQGVIKVSEKTIVSSSSTAKIKTSKGRAGSDEYYVIDLCDEILGMKASRQHKFDFLVGDTGIKLPVDAYYESLNLVIEYYERQHTEKVLLYDNRMTVSGVSRDVQRRIYDQRRQDVLPKNGKKLVIISYTDFGTFKKLKRNKADDILVVKRILEDYIKD